MDPYYQWSGLIRNYVRDNALCIVATDFDAKSRKIRHVALPVDDGEVANKRYVQDCTDFERSTGRIREEGDSIPK